jgi:acetyltransferase
VGAKLAANVPVRGNQVVVLSRSGGEAVITAYALREHGFSLPPLSPAIRRDIEARSRSGVIKPTNPIDLGDIFDFQVYTDIMSAICHDPDIDVVILNYGPLAEAEREEGRRMARLLVDLAREHQKTLAITVVCTLDEEDYLVKELGVPVFHFPGEAVRALAYSRYFAAKGQVAAAPAVPLPAPQEQKLRDLLAAAPGDGFMPMPQALSLMEALGLPLAPWWTVTEAGAAAAAAGSLGYPVVMKLSAPSLVHKTEAGAVLLNLMNEAAVRQAFARLEQAAKERVPPGEAWQVVVMQQVQGGREALLGTRRDPAFGPVAAFGTGGVETEILADVALRVAPLSAADARELMAETRLGRLLAGFRGEAPADLEGLGRALTALGQLLLTFPAVQEVDLNPVRVFPGDGGFMVLDARVRLG